jgi:hypothetical protein
LSSRTGLVRNVVIARRFTIGTDLDAYYAAFKLPDLLFTVVAGVQVVGQRAGLSPFWIVVAASVTGFLVYIVAGLLFGVWALRWLPDALIARWPFAG